MSDKELVQKVIEKLAGTEQQENKKLALDDRILKQIPNLINEIKKSKDVVKLMEDNVKILGLDAKGFADLIETLVKRYQVTLDPEIKKQFKILVKKPELQIYLKGLIF